MGRLFLTLPRTSEYDVTIILLGMQESTWVRGRNWLGKPTLMTLIPASTDWEIIYRNMVHAYETGVIDTFEYSIEKGNTMIRHGNWIQRLL
jgi:hypothetical protein